MKAKELVFALFQKSEARARNAMKMRGFSFALCAAGGEWKIGDGWDRMVGAFRIGGDRQTGGIFDSHAPG